MTGQTAIVGLTAAARAASAAVAEFNQAMRRFARSMRRERRLRIEWYVPAAHAFTPNFDLRCTSPGCNLLPEEH